MMVLDMVGVSGITTNSDGLNEVVLVVLGQFLVTGVPKYHLRKHTGRVGARLPCLVKGDSISLLFFFV